MFSDIEKRAKKERLYLVLGILGCLFFIVGVVISCNVIVSEIREQGLKGVIESIWEGETLTEMPVK